VFARSVAAIALLGLAAGAAPAAGARSAATRGAADQEPQAGPQAPTAAAAPTAPAPRAPRIASYSIDARLDPSTRLLTGDQLVTWRNPSATAATALRFHLYYNAWRNSRSTWMRERRLGGDLSLEHRPQADWGWIDLGQVAVGRDGGAPADVTARLRFVAPDDGNPHDRTVVEIPLERPVEPGETLTVRMAWSSRVPRTFARTGVTGNNYFLAQWFPKIGVFGDSGWTCHQFHTTTEFFADFGSYDVRLTVPAGWTVGATGVARPTRDGPGRTTVHHYVQDDVHDFAWTTSPDYLDLSDTFTHPTLPPVRMRLLLQPEHRGQAARHFEATRAALRHYGEWLGPYPYGHITIVDPVWRSRTAGMEYPTLFTAGTNWLAPPAGGEPESVIIHEAGHQFLYGIVANNEVEHAWLDEGLNTYLHTRVLAQSFAPVHVVKRYFGGFIPWVFRDLTLSRDSEAVARASFRAVAPRDVQATPSWRYWPGDYAAASYEKPVLWMHTLERMLGWETMQRLLSTYFTRWAYRHPEPDDFFEVVREVSGRDLTWFFDEVHRRASTFDYGIDLLRSEPADVRGYVGDGAARTFAAGDADSPGYHTTVVVRRLGSAAFPVDVRVLLENGEEIRWHWDGREPWKQFEVDHASRARRADVDPDHVLLLDVNTLNNSAAIDPPGPRAARRWSLVWLVWLQDHLLTRGFFV
jgi:hypothetical protein